MEGTSAGEGLLDPKAESSSFASLLRAFRVAAELTQEELAERSGVSVRAISDLERGVKTRPQRATVELLSAGLSLDAAQRAKFEASVPSRHRSTGQPIQSLDLPVGGFLGSVPDGLLVARENEIARVRELVEVVKDGSGRLILLMGESGVGKTRLAQEATLIFRANGMHLTAGQCYEPQRGVAYYPFLEVLSRLVPAARSRLGFDPLRRWPQLRPLILEDSSNATVVESPSSGDGDQQRLFWAVAALIEALAATMPVAVALDDLHWADQSSLELLLHLAHQLRNAPVLLLGTYRDVEVGRRHPLRRVLRDLHREHLADEIAVGRLDQDGTRSLMISTLDGDAVTPRFVDLIHRHTDGNAFFAQEVVRTLVERGDAYPRDGAWDCRTLEEIVIPQTVHEAIGERLSRLSDEAQAILSEASVLGDTFDFDDLEAMNDRAEDEIDMRLEEATRASVIRFGAGDSYSFNHALIQHFLYQELTPRRRRRLHLLAGQAIERQPERIREQRSVELTWHFREGGRSDRALHYAIFAGDQAGGRFAHREAERYYRLALDLARSHSDVALEASIQEKLGETLSATERFDEAIQCFDTAAATYQSMHDANAEIRVTARIGIVHKYRLTPDEGIARAKRILKALGDRDPSLDQSPLHLTLAFLYFGSGRYSEQLTEAEIASKLARSFNNDKVFVLAEERRATALTAFGDSDQASRALRDVIPLAERVGDDLCVFRALLSLAEIHRLHGQYNQMREFVGRAVEVAIRYGSPSRIAFAFMSLGRVRFLQGAWEEAESSLLRALEVAPASSNWFTPYPTMQLAELRLAQGAWGEGSSLLRDALIRASDGDLQALRFAHRALAEFEVFKGEPRRQSNDSSRCSTVRATRKVR